MKLTTAAALATLFTANFAQAALCPGLTKPDICGKLGHRYAIDCTTKDGKPVIEFFSFMGARWGFTHEATLTQQPDGSFVGSNKREKFGIVATPVAGEYTLKLASDPNRDFYMEKTLNRANCGF